MARDDDDDDDLLERFDRDGYVVVPRVLTSEELEIVRRECGGVTRAYATRGGHRVVATDNDEDLDDDDDDETRRKRARRADRVIRS